MRRVATFAVYAAAAAVIASGQAQTPMTLVPIVGNWKTGVEDGRQTITIHGSASPAPVDAAAAASLFGGDAKALLGSVGAAPPYPLAVARDVPDFRGGTLRVQFKLIDGTDDRSGGIVFNLKADGSYNFARYNTKDGNVAIWKFERGKRSVLAHGEEHQQLPSDQWHTLVVTVAGNDVTAVVNDTLRVRHTLEQPVSGRIGLWSKPDVVTSFRYLEVSK